MKKIDPPSSLRGKAGPGKSPRALLLYVEDNDDNWGVAELRLRQSYEILRATNAREACQLLQRRGGELEVILMDIELRGSELNGVELVEMIRGKRPAASLPDYARAVQPLSTPIFFVTAHGAKYSEEFLLSRGANRVIAKPVDFAALTQALTQEHLSRIAKR